MKALSLFYPYIEPHCPGVPVNHMQQALRTAAIRFCERTAAVQQVFTGNTVAGTATVDLDVPSQQQLSKVLEVIWKGQYVKLLSTEEVPHYIQDPASGAPTACYLIDPTDTVLNLYPVPNATETNVLHVRASFSPTRTATQFEDVLFDEYAEVIAAGALSILHSTPSAQYANPNAVMSNMAAFEAGIGTANRVSRRGRVRTSQSVRARSFV